jgi:hypothetical protein
VRCKTEPTKQEKTKQGKGKGVTRIRSKVSSIYQDPMSSSRSSGGGVGGSNNKSASRRAALAKLVGDKRKRLEGLSSTETVLDSAALDEDDVYDVLDEDEYRNLVESRRQREDFVVDDGASIL